MTKTKLGVLAVLMTLPQALTWSRAELTPAAPIRLSQFKLDGVTSIGVGGQTDETGVILKGTLSRGGGTLYRLAIEIKPLGTAFTNTPTAVSALTSYGTAAEVTVPLWKINHHWQAWGIDNNGVGQTASFPTSTPNDENQSDIEATYAGTIYYVSAAGNDITGAPDEPTRPYRSPLGAGAGAYSDIPADITGGVGDHVIQFMDGSTYGQLNMTPKTTDATHRIILRAAAGTTPTMDADSRADGSLGDVDDNLTLRILPDNVVVKGLHFRNTNLDPMARTDPSLCRGPGVDPRLCVDPMEVMVRLEGSNSVVEGSFFDGNGRTPTYRDLWLVICRAATNNLISGNRFDYSGGKAQLYVTASCEGGGSPGAQIIRNNTFSRFGQSPVHPGNSGALNFGGAIATYAGNNSIVENNTFWNNGGAAFGILNTNSSTLTVRNNIFAAITGETRGYAVGHSRTGVSSGTVYNSVMFGNTRNTSLDSGWTLSTYYTDDPYFVDTRATPPDLHVQSTKGSRRNNSSTWTVDAHCSVAIDKAAASDAFDAEPSPNGGRRNLGAYGNTSEASKSCGPSVTGVFSVLTIDTGMATQRANKRLQLPAELLYARCARFIRFGCS